MNRMCNLLAVFLISLACLHLDAQTASPSSQSQVVPRLVNFSGTATAPQGKTMSGVVGATFAIYKNQTEGAPLWIETQNIQADSRGNYIVQLGATKPDGLPLDLFTSGEARWLGVTVNGGQEQPRVLLLSVPYALKAADAETVGGLPPSAFVLAAPPVNAGTTASLPSSTTTTFSSAPPPASSNVTTTGGTVNALPLWTTSTNVQSSVISQTGTGTTAKVGINTTAPGATLDVAGSESVRGNLSHPATGTASAITGKTSQPSTYTASAYNSSTKAAVNENFRWQAEPTGNNTANPSGTMNLLFGSGTISETGLSLGSNGRINFAAGQTFPGTGTVTSVGLSAPSSDFTVANSPVTGSGTLGLNWVVPPDPNATPNALVKRDSSGGFAATAVSVSTLGAASSGTVISATMSGNTAQTAAISAVASATGTGNTFGVEGTSYTSNGAGVVGINRTSGYGVYGYASGTSGQGVWGESLGTQASNGSGSDGVHGIAHSSAGSGVAGTNYDPNGTGVYGNADWGFNTPNNVHQDAGAYGWVKAMATVNAQSPPYNITKCFNSQLHGAAAVTPPCGITLTEAYFGNFTLDFGFNIDNSFFSTAIREPDYNNPSTVISVISNGTVAYVAINVNVSGLSYGAAVFDLIVY